MIEKICPTCQTVFTVRKNKKFCSKPCADQGLRVRPKKRINKTCIECGSSFEIMPHDKDKPINYCSLQCVGKGKSKKFNYLPVDRICRWCGNSFIVDKPCRTTVCCSRKCAFKYMVENNKIKKQTILPEIKKYRQTHSSKETQIKFNMSETSLLNMGVYGENGIRRREHLQCTFNQEQHEALIGNLLGDGSLTYLKSVNSQSIFAFSQKRDFSEYVKGLHEIYQPFSLGYREGQMPKPSTVNGKINHDPTYWNGEYTYNSSFHSMAHPIFTSYRMKWYKDPFAKSKKIIPVDLKLTWRSAAMWMCDDGSNYCGPRTRHLILYTDCFTKDEVDFLANVINRDLHLIAKPTARNDRQYVIRICGDDWFEFIENIKPFIPWKCLQYKCINREKISLNTSGYIGISYHNQQKKWRAYGSNGQDKWSKIFSSKEEAINARKKWEEKINKIT